MGGYSKWEPDAWKTYSSTTKAKSASAIYTKTALAVDTMSPTNVLRESCDSPVNPESTPIIVALDVTGSMGRIAVNIARDGLGVLFQNILDKKPVSDPHIMIAGVGDIDYDRAPLQVSQFESNIIITKWLEDLYLEGGGGGNSCESYDLPYYFAAYRTKIDCFDKRNKKGYIFTVGDEPPPSKLNAAKMTKLFGTEVPADITFESILAACKKKYVPYHIIIEEGDHVRSHGLARVKEPWAKLLGQNVIVLSDYTKLAELIVSILEVENGKTVDATADAWADTGTSVVIRKALNTTTVAKHSAIVEF